MPLVFNPETYPKYLCLVCYLYIPKSAPTKGFAVFNIPYLLLLNPNLVINSKAIT